MKVTIVNNQSSLKIDTTKISTQIKALLEKENISSDEVIVNFVNEEKIKELHKRFFNNSSSTDCISLPIDSPFETKTGYSVLGEVFICTDAAISYAKKNNLQEEDELLLYIIHSILHLIGYDDIREKDVKIIRKKENEYITYLKNI